MALGHNIIVEKGAGEGVSDTDFVKPGRRSRTMQIGSGRAQIWS
jgi:hypothetical protein